MLSIINKSLTSKQNKQKKKDSIESTDIDEIDRKSTRLNSSHMSESRMPSSA